MLWEFIIVKSRKASSIARMVECVAAQLPRLSRSFNNTQGMESLRTTALSKKKYHLLETFSVSQCCVSAVGTRGRGFGYRATQMQFWFPFGVENCG